MVYLIFFFIGFDGSATGDGNLTGGGEGGAVGDAQGRFKYRLKACSYQLKMIRAALISVYIRDCFFVYFLNTSKLHL